MLRKLFFFPFILCSISVFAQPSSNETTYYFGIGANHYFNGLTPIQIYTSDINRKYNPNKPYDHLSIAPCLRLGIGSYYSESIYPIIWKEYQKEKEKHLLIQQLTARELEVLKLIVREMTSSEIAERLFISKKTVDNHRQNLLQKTQSKSTIGLVKYAMKLGIKLEE